MKVRKLKVNYLPHRGYFLDEFGHWRFLPASTRHVRLTATIPFGESSTYVAQGNERTMDSFDIRHLILY